MTWTRRFKFEPKTGANGFGIEGKIRYGICNESTCLPPHTEEFKLGDLIGAGPLPKALPDDSPKLSSANAAEGSIWFYLGAAFLGGMILNVMPCVLPVLAIKVLSFAQQAGESRSRVLALNVSYTIGVLAVFLTLATLAVGTQLGLSFIGDFSWGGLFRHTRFNLVMACIVFGMGLSLLGVFEIPVPGMVGSAAGQNQGEGLLGAFLTGIFATLLATPCTGPVMATALGWSIRQPPVFVYLIWGVMGFGMASPVFAAGILSQVDRLAAQAGDLDDSIQGIRGVSAPGLSHFHHLLHRQEVHDPATRDALGDCRGTVDDRQSLRRQFAHSTQADRSSYGSHAGCPHLLGRVRAGRREQIQS